MAKIVCLLNGNLETQDDCNQKKGIRRIFVAQRSRIDWAAMRANAQRFDEDGEVILGYEYLDGGAHYEVTFDRELATASATYTSDTGSYQTVVGVVLKGNSAERTRQLKRWVACCDLTVHAIMANGTERVYGVEYDGEVFDRPLQRMRITRHLDTPGQFGGDDARDEFDFGGTQEFAPLFASVGTQALRDSVTPGPQGNAVYGNEDDAYGTGSDAYGPKTTSAGPRAQGGSEKPAPASIKNTPDPKTTNSGKASK